jgi:hypothetical protein
VGGNREGAIVRRMYEPATDPARAPAATLRNAGQRRWWQECGIDEFRQRCMAMTRSDLTDVVTEINGSIAVTQTVVSDVNADPERRRKARYALGFMIEKRSLTGRLLNEHCRKSAGKKEVRLVQHEEKRERMAEFLRQARAAADDGRVADAILRLIDALETDWRISKEA